MEPDHAREQLDRLQRLFGVDAPALPVDQTFLVVPEQGVEYAAGSVLRSLGSLSGRDTPGGFWVPTSDPASHAFMGTYVTVGEYMPAVANLDLSDAADRHRRPSLIAATVYLNRIVGRESERQELTEAYAASLPFDVRERFQACLHANTGGLGRLIGRSAFEGWIVGRRVQSGLPA